MRTFQQYLETQIHLHPDDLKRAGFDWLGPDRLEDKVEVPIFKDPTPDELQIVYNHKPKWINNDGPFEARGLISGGIVYIWPEKEFEHDDISKLLKVPIEIAFYITPQKKSWMDTYTQIINGKNGYLTLSNGLYNGQKALDIITKTPMMTRLLGIKAAIEPNRMDTIRQEIDAWRKQKQQKEQEPLIVQTMGQLPSYATKRENTLMKKMIDFYTWINENYGYQGSLDGGSFNMQWEENDLELGPDESPYDVIYQIAVSMGSGERGSFDYPGSAQSIDDVKVVGIDQIASQNGDNLTSDVNLQREAIDFFNKYTKNSTRFQQAVYDAFSDYTNR